MSYRIGIDVGSTTVKVLVLDPDDNIIYKTYERHMSKVRAKTMDMLSALKGMIPADEKVCVAITGSAGLGLSKKCDIGFIQEVFATAKAVDRYLKDIDAVIELGGEDAKIIFISGGLEERMNGSCAGGTGAFIDQMANLLGVSTDEMDKMSLSHERIYSIASRCGVFAKSDIQPLLNQGANKSDIAASIFQAVVDQTIAGLAQGRPIKGKIAFLGGPLTFFKGLRERFVETLKLDDENAIFPEESLHFIAMGAALHAGELETIGFGELCGRIEKSDNNLDVISSLDPLFENETEYESFKARHAKSTVPTVDIASYSGKAYLGVDAGSTTTKLVLIDENMNILHTYYSVSRGNPVNIIKEQLEILYGLCGDRIKICGSMVTGYGEDLLRHAFTMDGGVVETVAHFTAARHFNPDVDFILDIGGQDIKCFRVRNNAIDSIILNEACSSGCGSFIQTLAVSLGYEVESFTKLGLMARKPVNLGSRCTVFMNSSVKQAQKEGAGVDDISAGISVSVVKNAIYKVIRAAKAADLGKNIVVQGGTFLNDAVLRSFEKELNYNVVRPAISGLMGAYGAALIAKERAEYDGAGESTLISAEDLKSFSHKSTPVTCGGCTNRCSLIVNKFSDNSKFISGNRCEKPLGIAKNEQVYNMYEYKQERLKKLQPVKGTRGTIGIPLVLNLYENIPFWHEFFTKLGFEVMTTGFSSRSMYTRGQQTIPSDTVCYPAKLIHGHMEELMDMNPDYIFYPCMSYNFDEENGDNHYNCPVVAYYPDLIKANVKRLREYKYLTPFFGIHRPKDFTKKAYEYFSGVFKGITKAEINAASRAAYAKLDEWNRDTVRVGEEYLKYARENDRRVIVLAGRPYHIDPEINHGIDRLISSFGFVIVSEDAVAGLTGKQKVSVLNQWTYHTRMYQAARYATEHEKTELIQLVSFGCGIDAITTDEIRNILESGGKFYTQLKIDEINNLGAVKIRIRSLLAAMEQTERNAAANSKKG